MIYFKIANEFEKKADELMKQHKLIVISLDSLGFRDLNELRQLTPTLADLIEKGTWVKKVEGIFPTLTYPSHTILRLLLVSIRPYMELLTILNRSRAGNRLTGSGIEKMFN